MKKTVLLLFLLSSLSSFSQMSFCEDFESYTVNDPIAQTSSNWNTWGELMSGNTAPFTDDANVSGAQSYSGSNSLYLIDPTGSGGTQDIILMFDTTQNITPTTVLSTPYTSGNLIFSQMMYIVPGKAGYFNFQAENIPGTTWALEVNFDVNGGITMSGTTLTGTYVQGVWFEIKFEINLTTNVWEMFVDGVSQGSFANATNKIASLDLYPNASSEYYVDNVCYSYTPFTPLAVDVSGVSMTTGPNLSLVNNPFIVSGELMNLGISTVTSMDINYSINGGTSVTQSLAGLNMLPLSTYSFNHGTTWTAPSTGTYQIDVWASNINGLTDMDSSNNVVGDSVHVWANIVQRIPLFETFTSSTCGPCNPGNINTEAIFAQNQGEYTSIKYQMSWPGAGDPYFTDEGDVRKIYYGVNSVPNLEIDGGWNDNSNNLTQQIFDTYASIPSFVDLSATYSLSGQSVNVNVTIDPVENLLSNNLVVHMVIFEEITYNNVKTNGETQFEHVVKKMLPNENGTAIASLQSGIQQTLSEQYTFQGTYILPPDATLPVNHAIEHTVENFANLGVAVWVQDELTKEVYQSTTANQITTTAQILSGSDDINLYPNPSSQMTFLNINLDTKSPVLIRLFNSTGKLVKRKDYGQMLGSHTLPIFTEDLSVGIYAVNIQIGEQLFTKKLIIE